MPYILNLEAAILTQCYEIAPNFCRVLCTYLIASYKKKSGKKYNGLELLMKTSA